MAHGSSHFNAADHHAVFLSHSPGADRTPAPLSLPPPSPTGKRADPSPAGVGGGVVFRFSPNLRSI